MHTCADSFEYLIDRLQELRTRTLELLESGKSDEARQVSLFIGGVVLRLFNVDNDETSSQWTRGTMHKALSMPWWHSWSVVAYPQLPHTSASRDAEAIVTQIAQTTSEMEFSNLMRMLRGIEAIKVKDSWLERCELTRLKAKTPTKEQVRLAIESGVEAGKLRVISENSDYPTAKGAPEWAQSGSFNGVGVDSFLLARRILQKNRNETRSCDLVTRIWRIRLASSGFHTANPQKAILKYLEGGHLDQLPVSKTFKEYSMGRVILSDAISSVEHQDEFRNSMEGWLLPPKPEKFSEVWHENRPQDWSIELDFLKKVASNVYQLGRPPFTDSGDTFVEMQVDGKKEMIMKAANRAASRAVAVGFGDRDDQCGYDFIAQKWKHLPYFDYKNKAITHDLNQYSTAGITWFEGLYGPADQPLHANACDEPRLRKLVYEVLLPKMDQSSANGTLFQKVFGIKPFGMAEITDEVPMALFHAAKQGSFGRAERESGLRLRLVSALTMRNKFYLQQQGGSGRIYFSPTPELRLKISGDLSMFRTWSVSPYCMHDLKMNEDTRESPRWEDRKDHPLIRTHQRWKRNFCESQDALRPADTLCHFSPAGGTATSSAAAILDSDPVCPFSAAYGDNYLWCSYLPILDVPFLAQLIAIKYHKDKKPGEARRILHLANVEEMQKFELENGLPYGEFTRDGQEFLLELGLIPRDAKSCPDEFHHLFNDRGDLYVFDGHECCERVLQLCERFCPSICFRQRWQSRKTSYLQ